MKRLITILISLTMIFTLIACEKKEETAKKAVGEALTAIKKLDYITARKYFDLDQILHSNFLNELDLPMC